MELAQSTVAQQVRFAGIQPTSDSGRPTKLDLSDGPIVVETTSGDAVGSIENYNDETGSFDVVLAPGASGPGTSVLTLKGDADMDNLEVREITLEFTYVVNAEEASGFQVSPGIVESLA